MPLPTSTHDLGHGWFVNFYAGDRDVGMTLRNPDKGQRIDVPPESYAKLRQIFRDEDDMLRRAAEARDVALLDEEVADARDIAITHGIR